MIKCNLSTVSKHVAACEEFDCNGTLTGKWTNSKPMTGKMNDPQAIAALDGMFLKGDRTFVIKSYDTPVAAWNMRLGWWITPLKHSSTTTKHMNKIRMGIN